MALIDLPPHYECHWICLFHQTYNVLLHLNLELYKTPLGREPIQRRQTLL